MGLLTYTVVSGDYLYKIAQEHATTVAAIWNHPANAAHRAKRGSPDVLYPGDVLQIPTEDVEPLVPPAPPASEPPSVGPPNGSWPYDRLPPLAPPRLDPTWECPAGICRCHEGASVEPLEHTITLFDDDAKHMPNARCRVWHNGQLLNESAPYANAAGEVTVELSPHTKWLEVEWAPHDCPLEPRYPFRRHYFVHMGEGVAQGVTRRLGNLGFTLFPNLKSNIAHFQRTYAMARTGLPQDVESSLFQFHDEAALPEPPPVEEPPRHHLGEGVSGAWPPSDVPAAGAPVTAVPLVDPAPASSGQEGDKHEGGALRFGAAAPSADGATPVQPFDPFLRAVPPPYPTSSELRALFADFEAQFRNVRFAVTELSDPFRAYFGARDTDVCFSASTCKLTALMTACMLLNSLRWFAWAAFWDGIDVDLDGFLDEAALRIRQPVLDVARLHTQLGQSVDEELLPVLSGRSGHARLGNLAPAFSVSAPLGPPPGWPPQLPWVDGPFVVTFSSSMLESIGKMMDVSSNEHSAKIIQTTGFGYIHGALKHAGLFHNDNGLWLAGDFGEIPRQKYHRRDIPCVNDRPTAQGATAKTFLQLVDMGLSGVFGEPLFIKAQLERSRVRNRSWLGRASGFEKYGFSDIMGKIGDSYALHGTVFSEVMVARHDASGRRFAICHQNSTAAQAIFGPLTHYIFPRLIDYISATSPAF